MNKQQWKGKPLLEQEKTLSRTTLMLSAPGRPGRRGGEGVGVGGQIEERRTSYMQIHQLHLGNKS